MEPENNPNHRFGFVAVTGRPNVGKSTIVNRIIGRELSIVTPKAQTTRHRITAIHTLPQVQIVLVDTPGFHNPKSLLNHSMMSAALMTLEQADLILFVTTTESEIPEDDLGMIDIIRSSKTKSVLAINKIDLSDRSRVRGLMRNYSDMHTFQEILPISAVRGSGIKNLVQVLTRLVPIGPPLYPEDDMSDLPLRFFVAEIIREQIIKMTGQEIPYKSAVMVEAFKEEQDRVLIQADIHTERESQKKILIGRQGAMIKQIGIAARIKLEAFLERKVRLELFVKVTPRWTTDKSRLKELGY